MTETDALAQLIEAARLSFQHFYHLDHSNAAIHGAPVRFSPITFRLGEALSQYGAFMSDEPGVFDVVSHRGKYREDTGR